MAFKKIAVEALAYLRDIRDLLQNILTELQSKPTTKRNFFTQYVTVNCSARFSEDEQIAHYIVVVEVPGRKPVIDIRSCKASMVEKAYLMAIYSGLETIRLFPEAEKGIALNLDHNQLVDALRNGMACGKTSYDNNLEVKERFKDLLEMLKSSPVEDINFVERADIKNLLDETIENIQQETKEKEEKNCSQQQG